MRQLPDTCQSTLPSWRRWNISISRGNVCTVPGLHPQIERTRRNASALVTRVNSRHHRAFLIWIHPLRHVHGRNGRVENDPVFLGTEVFEQVHGKRTSRGETVPGDERM
jgi:hypothetical protein